MINQVYRLVYPGQFEVTYKVRDLNSGKVIVRPKYLSVCNADQRYYQGKRDAAVLEKKLPMSLIHEGIGEVVFDPKGEFEVGQAVVMIPNLPVEEVEHMDENYIRSSRFRSSGYDGFMQDYVFMRHDRIVPLFDELNNPTASILELVTVAMHGISRFKLKSHGRKETIGIWGDGNLGYITSVLLKKLYPKAKIVVFGKTKQKIDYFTFIDEAYLIHNIPNDFEIDHAFECVGGPGSEMAIDQIIDHVKPMGSISLLGVSEDPVGINTRMVLEKGLTLFGSSRSGRADFVNTVNFLEEHKDVIHYLEHLVTKVVEVNKIEDIRFAFEEDQISPWGKTVMKWNI
ncbi:ribitol-5-phosphate dehydrogenase [Alkalihalobacillus alcalophilus ATCC 27647 = CGMCC 1.3604]|uniref:Ribulose-5-phosphate reductase n=1 Tax=Alkalihalobacillus alcalophilus ATCC 27647 = CGMCC 1.3604 TaxID=1218173 RepID=A0A094XDP1_ALKAL|nr:ribitol-5-phosphate dehydrogenase [Alkalihalobacillus alcalophilus]KGA96895.1 ribitol-5-phosphate dehydrogenase [Alkalihalobacillus alcalophilus ATCC 27647 = CGMCC 1.3604]MED1562638.1 ribitol-5-phosphate dehydrogenase [Alkalihalobacillus alcalophilus]THG88602.1 ribitol-5-phosphate dehydrogenase [Alkalihalobacillus alcalophilus ATCC 27647 = CGMCC 1.3604]